MSSESPSREPAQLPHGDQSLSAVIIARNAADRLGDCLATLGVADEIIVYDGGSIDATREIARMAGAHVIDAPDWQGFGIQRQRAQAAAKGPWVLMIDADERLTPGLAKEVRAAVDANDTTTVYALPRLSWVFGRYLRHGGWWPDYVVRLYHRDRGSYDDALVHERVKLAPDTHLAHLKNPLLHHTYADLHDYLVKSAGYAAAWASQRQQAGRHTSLIAALIHAGACFTRIYLWRAGFLDGRAGFLLAVLSAHSTFVKYADLWVRDHDSGPPAPGG